MFCQHCGKNLDDGAVICVHCGAIVDEAELVSEEAQQKESQTNAYASLGLIFGCIPFLFFLGLIYSIRGLLFAKRTKIGMKKAVVGLVLSSFFTVVILTTVVLFFSPIYL